MSVVDRFGILAVGLSLTSMGAVIGAIVESHNWNRSVYGTASYHAVKVLEEHDGLLIRLVRSPSAIDDRSEETIVKGVLMRRKMPANFDELWGEAK